MPRQCGIASFTTDLIDAIAAGFPSIECFVVAMNDVGRQHAYPARVRFELGESDVASYRRAADFLNVNHVDVLCLQHEYGIFGGKAGAHVLPLLRELRMPIVTTLHTILSEPSPAQKSVMDTIVGISQRLVVMTADGVNILKSVHGVREDKIDLIPHGIPNVPAVPTSKDELGLEGKEVILTFGLLSPDKGIEMVIDALPAVLQRHPNAIYVVVGATHPHIKQHHGEEYRISLEQRARRLGVQKSIVFHDRFVTQRELVEFLSVADVYVTPYLNPNQITSGTLAYAVGFGKAVISTPYRYARDLLAEKRGVLVPFADPAAIGRAIDTLLGDDSARTAMQQRAREYGRSMAWPVVARRYLDSFEKAHADHGERRRSVFHAKTLDERAQVPDIKLDHVRLMTDGTGILQHAAFDVPRYEDGYCLDDNARALLLMALIEDAGAGDVHALGARYMAFVNHSFDERIGRFRNFMSYTRSFTEPHGSDDSHGRAMWALGTVVGKSGDPGRQSLADRLFHSALPAVLEFTSPRAWAYALLGINEYLRPFHGESNVQSVRNTLALRLVDIHQRASRADWPWFEERVTYCNARLSQALIVSGARMENQEMVSIGLKSLEWLDAIQSTEQRYFAPIGSNGFYLRDGARAHFDQQPVEACAMVSACLDAWRQSNDAVWLERGGRAFQWFLGHNQLQQSLYDARTGGCRDGLHEDRANENQGAESTLSFLMALLEMRSVVAS